MLSRGTTLYYAIELGAEGYNLQQQVEQSHDVQVNIRHNIHTFSFSYPHVINKDVRRQGDRGIYHVHVKAGSPTSLSARARYYNAITGNRP